MRYPILLVGASVLAAAALGAWLRFGLVEPQAVALACVGEDGLACQLRALTIASFQRQALSWAGLLLVLVSGLWGLTQSGAGGAGRVFGIVLLIVGAALGALGALLYGPEPGVAAALAALWLASSRQGGAKNCGA
ncbi:MAG: hypothetical protein R3E83_16050 [Burkholderiaceae bacterium]